MFNKLLIVTAYFVSIIFITVPIPCTAETLPEYFGIYARYKNGDLVELERQSQRLTKKGCIQLTENFGMKDVPVMSYVSSSPSVVLDMSKVDAFYIYGDNPIENNTNIYYLADYKYFNDSLCTDEGFGQQQPAYIDIGWSCGPSDGMKYKKIQDGMYKFKFPVQEDSDYKFCDLFAGKEAGSGDDPFNPKTQVSFYGWYYGGNFYTFATKKTIPFITIGNNSVGADSSSSSQKQVAKSKVEQNSQNKSSNKPIQAPPRKQRVDMARKLVADTLESGKIGVENTTTWEGQDLIGVTPTKNFKFLKKFPCREYKVIYYGAGQAETKLNNGTACRAEGKWYPYEMLKNPSKDGIPTKKFNELLIGANW